jgi:flagellar motor switch protein FliM
VNEILTNEEIDTLLHLFRSEGAAAEAAAKAAAAAPRPTLDDGTLVTAVDLLKPNRLSREHIKSFERYFENAGKMLSATITDRLRLDTRCDCVAVEQTRFQSWLEQLPGPVAIYVLKMEPLGLPVLFTATTSMLYGAVDRILGGTGKVNRVPKDFTQAEYTVADALVGPCLDRICESLAEMLPLKWSVESRFCNPTLAQILPSQDVVLSVYFQAAGDFLIGDLRLVFPFHALEPHLGRTGQDTARRVPSGTMRATVARTVAGVPLDLSVLLGSARIQLRQLLTLQPGDVVPIDARIGDPAVVPVQGRPKFHGHIGRMGNRLALQVADVMGT